MSKAYQLQRESDFIDRGIAILKERLDAVEKNGGTSEDHSRDIDAESDFLDSEIASLQAELKEVDMQHKEVQHRRVEISQSLRIARQHRDVLMERVASFDASIDATQEQIFSVDEETVRVVKDLNKYKQINTLNDAFFIWYSGPYGTLNTLRLGSIPAKPVEWNEINAVLGQAALLVSIISEKAKVQFSSYQILPMGSYARILKAEDKRLSYPLFIDKSTSWQFWPKSNFNSALLGFITCVFELGEFVSKHDPTLTLPYKISITESRIADISFVYDKDDESWTRALKFMLSDIKWIVAWYSKHLNSMMRMS